MYVCDAECLVMRSCGKSGLFEIPSGILDRPSSDLELVYADPRSVETRIGTCGPYHYGGSATEGIGADNITSNVGIIVSSSSKCFFKTCFAFLPKLFL